VVPSCSFPFPPHFLPLLSSPCRVFDLVWFMPHGNASLQRSLRRFALGKTVHRTSFLRASDCLPAKGLYGQLYKSY
jgi:hypothetical protein